MLWAIPAAISAGSAAYNWHSKRKDIKRGLRQLKRMGPYEKTAEGALLSKRAAEGSIGSKERSIIMGQVGRESGSAAAMGKSAYLARGMKERGRSISLAGGAAKFDLARQRTLGETSEKIALENERSKILAQEQLASGKGAYDRDIKGRRQALKMQRGQADREGVTGLLGAGASVFSAFQADKAKTEARELKLDDQVRDIAGRRF